MWSWTTATRAIGSPALNGSAGKEAGNPEAPAADEAVTNRIYHEEKRLQSHGPDGRLLPLLPENERRHSLLTLKSDWSISHIANDDLSVGQLELLLPHNPDTEPFQEFAGCGAQRGAGVNKRFYCFPACSVEIADFEENGEVAHK